MLVAYIYEPVRNIIVRTCDIYFYRQLACNVDEFLLKLRGTHFYQLLVL